MFSHCTVTLVLNFAPAYVMHCTFVDFIRRDAKATVLELTLRYMQQHLVYQMLTSVLSVVWWQNNAFLENILRFLNSHLGMVIYTSWYLCKGGVLWV